MRLSYVRLLVADFTACFRFYRDVLGFTVVWGDEPGPYAEFSTSSDGAADASLLALVDRALMADAVQTSDLPPNVSAQDRAMLIFDVQDASRLDAIVRRLEALGVEFANPPHDQPVWGIRAAHLRDPDGTLIELNCPLAED